VATYGLVLKAAADPCTIEQLGALPSGSTEVLMAAFAFVDNNGFVTHRCPGCGGASHPATGCAYSPTFVWCWACTLDFARWVQRHTNEKGGRRGVGFYDYVGLKR
jgi:hypothetical protein